MDSSLDVVEPLIGIGIFSYLVADVYLFWPKRMKKLEASNDPRDVKRLGRMKWALDVMKLRQALGVILVFIVVTLLIDFGLELFLK